MNAKQKSECDACAFAVFACNKKKDALINRNNSIRGLSE